MKTKLKLRMCFESFLDWIGEPKSGNYADMRPKQSQQMRSGKTKQTLFILMKQAISAIHQHLSANKPLVDQLGLK